MSREAGKGSTPRPFSVDIDTYSNNWDNIFKRKSEPEQPVVSGENVRIETGSEEQG